MAQRYWEDAVERSKIQRISWKKVLGKSLNRYVYDALKLGYEQDEIIHQILLLTKDPQRKIHFQGWSFPKIVENVQIGVSARCSEFKILEGVNKKWT